MIAIVSPASVMTAPVEFIGHSSTCQGRLAAYEKRAGIKSTRYMVMPDGSILVPRLPAGEADEYRH